MSSPQSILEHVFGYERFRPGQAQIIDHIFSGDNVLAIMPTGAGKSLCYQVPALLLDGVTVIVSPLLALMNNQVDALRANGVAVACIHSGQSRADNIAQWKSVVTGEAKLLYMSPERLMTPRMMSAMAKLEPAMFVIDEAHCVSKWGPSFRPDYADLTRLHTLFPQARIAAFTATADAASRKDIAQRLFGGKGQTILQGFDRPNLSLAVAPSTNRKGQLLDFMRGRHGQSGIVYALSRKNTEKFADALTGAGFKALPYHAGLDGAVRRETENRFLAEDGLVIVATIAFGMGIDKPDIRFVYHTNLPGSLEAYYQEIGRAGRDGAPADTALCFGLDDVQLRRKMILEDGGQDDDHRAREFQRLEALLSYCEAASCRRQVLLAYFGEAAKACGNCDNCINPPEMIDATDDLKAVLDAIAQTGSRFGQSHIIAVARGADTQRLRELGHDKLSAFGRADHRGQPYLRALIRQAVAAGYLSMDIERYGALSITPSGEDVQRGAASFTCKVIKAASKSRKPRAAAAGSISLTEDDAALLSRLKARRLDIAREIGKPAYIVFSDATLMDMAQKRPETREQMLDVSGVGDVKFERFGTAFLEVVRDTG